MDAEITAREAAERLEIIAGQLIGDKTCPVGYAQAIDKAVSLLRKQEPAQVITHTSKSGEWRACPACDAIATRMYKYCPTCGQALKF